MQLWKKLFGAKEAPNAAIAPSARIQVMLSTVLRIKALLRRLVTPPKPEQTGEAADDFCLTASLGYVEDVRALLKRNPKLIFSRHELHDGGTALHMVASQVSYTGRRKEMTKLLLAYGAEVNARDAKGRTPLHLAAAGSDSDGSHMAMAGVLLANGADVSATDKEGFTAFYYAGHDFADLLRRYGGRDDVHSAAKRGDLASVEALVKADPNAVFTRTRDGSTPLHRAAHWGDVVRFLLASGAEVGARDEHGDTPLHNADSTVVELLVASKAEVDARNNKGETPLMKFSQEPEIVKLLMAHGADVNARDERGERLCTRQQVLGGWIR